ncbi:hypothetical protein GCM10010233_64570 [Streptomyces pseudogriseolus]|nr:hypothetical protein GCM10010233_64570 [Streptomyces gancidicus]
MAMQHSTSHARTGDDPSPREERMPENTECSVAQKKFRAAQTCRSGSTTKQQNVQQK